MEDKILDDDYYSEIPNALYYVKNNKSIFQRLKFKDHRILLVLDYLYTNTNRKGIVKFTLDDLIISCYCKPNSRKGKSNSKFISLLQDLDAYGIIKLDSQIDLNNVKSKDLITCKYIWNLKDKGYFQLYENGEKNKIINYKDDNIDKIALLFFYCYLKRRINKVSKDRPNDLVLFGGRAAASCLSYDIINQDTLLSESVIKKYNDILVKLDLIRIGNAGRWHYKKSDKMIDYESPNHYTLFNGNEEDAALQLKESIKYYKSLDINSGKVFINSRTYKNNNRHIFGKYGSLVKKANNGTLTEKESLELQNFKNNMDNKNRIKELQTILQKHPDEILSSIYMNDFYNEEKGNKIFDIEAELGLIDQEQHLLVDKKYYDWIITNYNSDGSNKPYLKNCVNKHKDEMKQEEFEAAGIM